MADTHQSDKIESKKVTISMSSTIYSRLHDVAADHEILRQKDDAPSATRAIHEIIRNFLSVEKMEGLANVKKSEHATTMQIIRTAVSAYINERENPTRGRKY